MSKKNSKTHHWWPKKFQDRYWTDSTNKVRWVDPDGKPNAKNPNNNKTGQKRRGHTIFPGADWATNFEVEFGIDDKMHEITQIYAKEYLFYKGEIPELEEDFRCHQFLEHKHKADPLIEFLDQIVYRQLTPVVLG